jgi:hypothetical protein
MVNKEVHDEYIRIYNELIDTINHKEDMIQAMTLYIAKYAKKVPSICKVNKGFNCNYRKCKECVRNYFERKIK